MYMSTYVIYSYSVFMCRCVKYNSSNVCVRVYHIVPTNVVLNGADIVQVNTQSVFTVSTNSSSTDGQVRCCGVWSIVYLFVYDSFVYMYVVAWLV